MPQISRNGTWLAVGVLVAGFLLPLRGLLVNQGPPMEEGFMLVFPERFLEGDLPNRDFLHLYGPGSVWALAGVFKVFGVSLWSERAVALLQQGGVVFGVFALALPWGRRIALACGLVSLVIIIPPIGLTALAWVGGLALGLWGLKAALHARGLENFPRSAGRYALLAGVLGGLALLYRPDLVLAIGLGGAAVVWGLDRRLLWRVGAGLAIGVSPYVLHFATVGFGDAFRGMVLDPVVYLRGAKTNSDSSMGEAAFVTCLLAIARSVVVNGLRKVKLRESRECLLLRHRPPSPALQSHRECCRHLPRPICLRQRRNHSGCTAKSEQHPLRHLPANRHCGVFWAVFLR